MEMMEKDKLRPVLFAIGIACVLCIIVLIAAQRQRNKESDLIPRADYLIARSETSLERWAHARR
jgi:hypothetical protein